MTKPEPSLSGCVNCTHQNTVPHTILKNTSPLPQDHCGFSPRSLWDHYSYYYWCVHTGRENGSAAWHCCWCPFIQCCDVINYLRHGPPACTANAKLWLNMRKNKMAAGANTTTRNDYYITLNLREWCSRSTPNLSHMLQEFTFTYFTYILQKTVYKI